MESICGEPPWKVTRLSKPDAPMLSAASTVTTLFIPETEIFTQWPVMFTVLRMPLTVTLASLHEIVLFTSIPETVRSCPGAPVMTPESVWGAPGAAGMLGMLGISTDGNAGTSMEPPPLKTCGPVDADILVQTKAPIPMATRKTTAMMPNTAHGMPADGLRGGAPYGAFHG